MTVATEDSLIAQRILEAAVHLFAHKGYDATSIREITEAAGVTKPMLYYYFENKEGLCRAIFARFLEQHHSRLREVLESETDPFELLVGVVWGAFDICRQNMDFARLFLALYFSPEAQVGGVNLCEAPKEGLTLLEEAVNRVAKSGLIRPNCEAAISQAINGMIHIWVITALKEEGVTLTQQLARQIVEDLLTGFGANKHGAGQE